MTLIFMASPTATLHVETCRAVLRCYNAENKDFMPSIFTAKGATDAETNRF